MNAWTIFLILVGVGHSSAVLTKILVKLDTPKRKRKIECAGNRILKLLVLSLKEHFYVFSSLVKSINGIVYGGNPADKTILETIGLKYPNKSEGAF